MRQERWDTSTESAAVDPGVRGHDGVVCMQGSRSPRVMKACCEPPAGLTGVGSASIVRGTMHRAVAGRRGPRLVANNDPGRVGLNSEQIAQPRRDPSHASSGSRSCSLSRPPTLYRTKITKAECAALIEVNTKVVVCRHCGRVNARSSGSSFDTPVSARRYQRIAGAQAPSRSQSSL